jgi:RES domain-containing protein
VIFYRFGARTKRPAAEEFDGTGGLLGAGRWHIKGTKVVYAANNEPLALLEKVVHRSASRLLVYPLYFADVPDDLVDELPANKLPHDWKSIYPPKSTMQLGADWLASNKFVALLVPSVLISGRDKSRNCLINPAHPKIGRVEFSGPEMIAYDPRFPV